MRPSMEGGFLKLWRLARHDPLLRSLPGEQFKATIGILCCVNWKAAEYMCPKCGKTVEIPEGATVKSVRTLAEEGFGVARMAMHRTLARLVKVRFLSVLSTSRCHRIYLVNNWAKYQSDGTEAGHGRDRGGTRAGQIEEGKKVKKGKKRTKPDSSVYLPLARWWGEHHPYWQAQPSEMTSHLQGWAEALRLLMENDGRTEEEVRTLAGKIFADHDPDAPKFPGWRDNCVSPAKFRQKKRGDGRTYWVIISGQLLNKRPRRETPAEANRRRAIQGI